MKMIALVILFLTASGTAQADEFRLGYGVNCGITAGDGAWNQDGMPSQTTRCRDISTIQYIGTTPIIFGSINFNYGIGAAYRRGVRVVNGEWLTDACYGRRQYSGGEPSDFYGSGLVAECDKRYNTRNVESTTRAITLTLGPAWHATRELSFSGMVGLTAHESTTKVEWENARGACAITHNCTTVYYRRKAISSYFELSGTYQHFFVTAYYAPNEHGEEAAQVGNYGVFAGVRVPLSI